MLHEIAPVTGSWENIVSMIRAMVAAGLCRVDFVVHEYAEYTCARMVIGDDSEVRAFYDRMRAERDQMRKEASEQRSPIVANMMHQAASELLIRYQERSYTVNERPYDLNTNIYGWCMGSQFLSNLYGGPYAITTRGSTLEDCIALGCELAKDKGTTLSFNVLKLPVSIPEIVDLVRLAGGSQQAIDWVLDEPFRRSEREKKRAARDAELSQQRAQTSAFADEQIQIVEAAALLLASDPLCFVTADATGLTVRGRAHNPSFRLTVEHHGWKIVRTDFDGVRKELSRVAGADGKPVRAEVVTAVETAWMAIRARGRA